MKRQNRLSYFLIKKLRVYFAIIIICFITNNSDEREKIIKKNKTNKFRPFVIKEKKTDDQKGENSSTFGKFFATNP